MEEHIVIDCVLLLWRAEIDSVPLPDGPSVEQALSIVGPLARTVTGSDAVG